MKVREHVWVADRCIACGAASWETLRREAREAGRGDPGTTDGRQCIEREDYAGKLMPEPARRQLACEDGDAIAARIAELRAERLEAANAVPKE